MTARNLTVSERRGKASVAKHVDDNGFGTWLGPRSCRVGRCWGDGCAEYLKLSVMAVVVPEAFQSRVANGPGVGAGGVEVFEHALVRALNFARVLRAIERLRSHEDAEHGHGGAGPHS